jgi:REP-associated tyrosine transposase
MYTMPRRPRCVLAGVPHHVTQRGVNRCSVFETDCDRSTYLRLLRDNLLHTDTHLLGWCLMTNHVHLVVTPGADDSLALLLRRVHGRYAQYFNARTGRSGHLWQNRYFACALGAGHVWPALAYVDRNPVRAGMTASPQNYAWSSAAPHLAGEDPSGLLDLEWWHEQGLRRDWQHWLDRAEPDTELEKCTYAGRPFGDADFVKRLGDHFGRRWQPGRPKTQSPQPRPPEGPVT